MTDQNFSISVAINAASRVSATIDIAGATHLFIPDTELDSYHDPLGAFVQRCFLCTTPTLPGFRVYYRPDVGGTREEWVFEYGDPWATSIQDLPSYTARIVKANGEEVSILAPSGHWWFSRWRWQSAPRPVRFTFRDLAEEGLIPWFETTGLSMGPILTVNPYIPMALCGIPADQGQTGIYPGIGLITGWQAQYGTRKQDPSGEYLFRNQGEASGSFQQHVRDPKTGAPFNWVNQYPNATMYSANVGSPFFSWTRQTKTDSGHHPSLAYVPFLLTGDPYYLEEVQFLANHVPLLAPPKSRWSDRGRYFAWPLRSVAQAYLATPDDVPSWMLPRSYFNSMLDQIRPVAMKHVNSVDPWDSVFHSMMDYGQSSIYDPVPSGSHVWQDNYTSLVLAWMVGAGFDDWRVVAEWAIRGQIDRASKTSGYMRAYPSPYHIRLRNASALAEAMTTSGTTLKMQYQDTFKNGESVTVDTEQMTLVSSADKLTWQVSRPSPRAHSLNAAIFGNKHTSWPMMMESNKLTKPDYWIQPPGDTFGASVTDLTYPSNHRAALAQAWNSGLFVQGLQDSFTWMDTEVRKRASSKTLVGENWAVVPHGQRARRHRGRRP